MAAAQHHGKRQEPLREPCVTAVGWGSSLRPGCGFWLRLTGWLDQRAAPRSTGVIWAQACLPCGPCMGLSREQSHGRTVMVTRVTMWWCCQCCPLGRGLFFPCRSLQLLREPRGEGWPGAHQPRAGDQLRVCAGHCGGAQWQGGGPAGEGAACAPGLVQRCQLRLGSQGPCPPHSTRPGAPVPAAEAAAVGDPAWLSQPHLCLCISE